MSMKALGVTATGASSNLKLLEVPIPTILAEDILVKIHAFGLNPADLKVRDGTMALLPPDLKITGWDASGVVESIGANVKNIKVGDEVFFAGSLVRQGSNAEYTAVDYRLVALKPKSVDHVTASSMPLTAVTAWEGLEEKLRLSIPKSADDATAQFNASQSLLVTAAAGGVGSIIIQLAKKVFKVGKVIAVTGRPESADWVRKMGADLVLDRSKSWKTQLQENGLDGVNLVYSCIELEDIFDELVSVVLPMGRICGIAINHKPLNVAAFFMQSISLDWECMGTRPIYNYQQERHGQILAQLASAVDSGIIKHWVGRTFDVASAETLREAHDLQASGKMIGKIAFAANFQ